MKCRIILEKTPNNVGFGIQKGKGSQYEIEQFQLGNGQNLCFDCAAQVKKTNNGSIDFSGVSIQGTTQERFIYINIGTSAGQAGSIWTRRLKVPLRGITEEMVLKANENESLCLETIVPAIGKDGKPNCATVKPFAGWSVKNIKM
jgi:Family of unknown function (DUF5990)